MRPHLISILKPMSSMVASPLGSGLFNAPNKVCLPVGLVFVFYQNILGLVLWFLLVNSFYQGIGNIIDHYRVSFLCCSLGLNWQVVWNLSHVSHCVLLHFSVFGKRVVSHLVFQWAYRVLLSSLHYELPCGAFGIYFFHPLHLWPITALPVFMKAFCTLSHKTLVCCSRLGICWKIQR